MTHLRGLNVDPVGRAHIGTIQRTGANAVRPTMMQWDGQRRVDVVANVARYVNARLDVLATFARESIPDETGRMRTWQDALRDYATLVGPAIRGVILGNEYSNTGGASWHLSAAAQSELIQMGAEAFLAVNPACWIVSGAIGTGQPSDLAVLDLEAVTHCAVNLYNESVGGWPPDAFGSAEWLLPAFWDAAGRRPLILTEWSTTNDDQAARYIPMSAAYYRSLPYVAGDFYFRYQDGGDEQRMGLFDAAGQPTVRWPAYLEANAQDIPDTEVPVADETWMQAKPRIEEQIHLLVENQRRILQGDWNTARVFLDAIDPNMAGHWTNADFPGTPTAGGSDPNT